MYVCMYVGMYVPHTHARVHADFSSGVGVFQPPYVGFRDAISVTRSVGQKIAQNCALLHT
jgi:hypothetical protein